MLKLNYIIIGKLPKEQEAILLKNLACDRTKTEQIGEADTLSGAGERGETDYFAQTCRVIVSGENTAMRLADYPARESLLVSGSGEELQAAYMCGMAALGYLPPEGELKIAEEKRPAPEGKHQGPEERDSAPEGEAADENPQGEEFAHSAPADMYAEGFEEIGATFLLHVYERHHGIPWTILRTKRCVVKEFSMEYLDALFELYAGEGMTDYIEPLYPYEEERAYQEAYIEHMYRFYGYGMWIVCDKETGALIGRAGIEHREELGGELELGYAIGVPWQRRGYATEVCTAILDYAREELDVPSVCCLIEEGNTVSEHLAKKLGLGWRGTLMLGGKRMHKYVTVTPCGRSGNSIQPF
ncbi:MAG: GNAT family N-acetyltransferase [Roseburia sp.]|nr:GNAT family N-acetyltransferase [Roseburia sp.]